MNTPEKQKRVYEKNDLPQNQREEAEFGNWGATSFAVILHFACAD
jgi:hypothetical protein